MEVPKEWTLKNSLHSLLIAVILIYLIRWLLRKNKNCPPGPIGLPIVGYLPFLRKDPHEKLCKLQKIYGGIFGFYLGSKYTVVLNDYPSVKEGLNNPNLLSRPPNLPLDVLNEFDSTKTGFGGKYWIEQRRFMLHVLRDLGFGKNKMEEYITQEIYHFINDLKSLNGKPCIVKELTTRSVSNVICSLIFGRRLEYNSPERKLLDEGLKDVSEILTQTSIQVYIPLLKPIMMSTDFFNFKKGFEAAKKISTFEEIEIDNHERTLDVNNIRDYIDGYLVELKKRKEDSKSYFNRNMMKQTLQFLLGAGSRTVHETLNWAFLIMAKYQDVQKRVQQEIDDVIGRIRQPMWADHVNLPYTQAVIYEIQRWRTLLPLNLLRYCIEETTIQGLTIPKGSIVITNIWSVHNDKDYWKDPEIFRPERFLDATGKKVIRHDLYIPFSLGKMSCVGESMAKEEVFLFFSSVMQQFSIKSFEENVDLKGILELPYVSKNQKLYFLSRCSRYTIVLTNYSSIKEGLNNSFMLARPPQMSFDILLKTKFNKGLLIIAGFGGKRWLEHRRFVFHTLRELGFGRRGMEEFITEEISFVIEKFQTLKGKPLQAVDILTPSISNVICFLLFGKRLEYDSPERKLLDESLNVVTKFFGQSSIQMSIPWLKPFMYYSGIFNYNKTIAAASNITTFIKKEVKEHEKTLDINCIRDYIDGYLIELKKEKHNIDSYFDMEMLLQTVLGLFGAGSATVQESLSWAFLIMAKYQNIQKRVQQEIYNKIGRHRRPTWGDHPKLPFTQAVICEMQRWKTIIPLNVLRCCQEDTTLKGYTIPKGSIVLANIWSAHNDKAYWKDPEVFRPERFLDETGSKLIRHDYYIPFSLGKMSCPGETLAKTELFLYFTTMLQNFTIKPPEGVILDMEGTLGIAYASKPQKLCYLEREHNELTT
ncbi:cytochrome P450 2C28-like [Centruroides vittatus]|uniref:cytochrome P450 2C28-like n=1 Tax=Centruroides vittatus TaxID=120091 RepID=UPI00350F9DAC